MAPMAKCAIARFCQHAAGIAGQRRGGAEHDHQPQAGIGHEGQRLSLDPRIDHLRHRARDRDRRRQHHIVGGEVDDEKDDRREEIGGQSSEWRPSCSGVVNIPYAHEERRRSNPSFLAALWIASRVYLGRARSRLARSEGEAILSDMDTLLLAVRNFVWHHHG